MTIFFLMYLVLFSGSIKSNFYPIGYTAVLLPGYLLAGIQGIIITQAFFYIVAILYIVNFLVKDLKYPLENFYVLLLITIHALVLLAVVSACVLVLYQLLLL